MQNLDRFDFFTKSERISFPVEVVIPMCLMKAKSNYEGKIYLPETPI